MDSIPIIADDEIFLAIEEQPNFKRVNSTKTNYVMKFHDNSCFRNNEYKKDRMNALNLKME